MIALVCGVVVVYVYVGHYMKYAPDVKILQTSISNHKMALVLQERYPIVIDEAVVDSNNLFSTIFKYQYSFKQKTVLSSSASDKRLQQWRRCFSRFTVVVSQQDKLSVDVRHPFKPLEVTRIKMRRDQSLILPPRWLFRPVPSLSSQSGGAVSVIIYEAYDLLHLLLRPFAALLLSHNKH